jgi:ABC-type uncharacterized transport system involved in gliding motility auxiliary subunit
MFGRIANILGWAGVALVLAGVVTWLVRPEMVGLRQGFAISGLVCIVVYAASQWREMGATFTKRSARYGALAVVSLIVVVGLLIGLNYLASKYNRRWDLSASKDFTLSDQTRRVIGSLKEPLKLFVFDLASAMQPYRDRLGEYEYLSKQVQVEYIDLDKDPSLARQYQIQTRGTIVVEYQKRVERVTTGGGEQEITNAIIKAVQGKQRKLYFLTGHGEKDPGSSDERSGYNGAAAELQRDNFTVATLALTQQPDVPADADAVAIAGPTRDYLPTELDALRRYLNKGGKALVLLDPPDTTTSPPLTNLVAFAAEWGFDVGNNVVVDLVGQAPGRGAGDPVIANYPGHPITERFRFYTMFPLARSVSPAKSGTRTAQPLLMSSEQSWAESDLKALPERRPVSFDATDRKGPVELGAALAIPAPDGPPPTPPAPGKPAPDAPRAETRIVVIGDSDFAANEALAFQGNSNFLANVVNWLAQQENLIAIRPKAPDDRRVTMTEDQLRLVTWLSLVFIPGAVFAVGVHAWWRRRG